jgi:hypothetical protein
MNSSIRAAEPDARTSLSIGSNHGREGDEPARLQAARNNSVCAMPLNNASNRAKQTALDQHSSDAVHCQPVAIKHGEFSSG